MSSKAPPDHRDVWEKVIAKDTKLADACDFVKKELENPAVEHEKFFQSFSAIMEKVLMSPESLFKSTERTAFAQGSDADFARRMLLPLGHTTWGCGNVFDKIVELSGSSDTGLRGDDNDFRFEEDVGRFPNFVDKNMHEQFFRNQLLEHGGFKTLEFMDNEGMLETVSSGSIKFDFLQFFLFFVVYALKAHAEQTEGGGGGGGYDDSSSDKRERPSGYGGSRVGSMVGNMGVDRNKERKIRLEKKRHDSHLKNYRLYIGERGICKGALHGTGCQCGVIRSFLATFMHAHGKNSEAKADKVSKLGSFLGRSGALPAFLGDLKPPFQEESAKNLTIVMMSVELWVHTLLPITGPNSVVHMWMEHSALGGSGRSKRPFQLAEGWSIELIEASAVLCEFVANKPFKPRATSAGGSHAQRQLSDEVKMLRSPLYHLLCAGFKHGGRKEMIVLLEMWLLYIESVTNVENQYSSILQQKTKQETAGEKRKKDLEDAERKKRGEKPLYDRGKAGSLLAKARAAGEGLKRAATESAADKEKKKEEVSERKKEWVRRNYLFYTQLLLEWCTALSTASLPSETGADLLDRLLKVYEVPEVREVLLDLGGGAYFWAVMRGEDPYGDDTTEGQEHLTVMHEQMRSLCPHGSWSTGGSQGAGWPARFNHPWTEGSNAGVLLRRMEDDKRAFLGGGGGGGGEQSRERYDALLEPVHSDRAKSGKLKKLLKDFCEVDYPRGGKKKKLVDRSNRRRSVPSIFKKDGRGRSAIAASSRRGPTRGMGGSWDKAARMTCNSDLEIGGGGRGWGRSRVQQGEDEWYALSQLEWATPTVHRFRFSIQEVFQTPFWDLIWIWILAWMFSAALLQFAAVRETQSITISSNASISGSYNLSFSFDRNGSFYSYNLPWDASVVEVKDALQSIRDRSGKRQLIGAVQVNRTKHGKHGFRFDIEFEDWVLVPSRGEKDQKDWYGNVPSLKCAPNLCDTAKPCCNKKGGRCCKDDGCHRTCHNRCENTCIRDCHRRGSSYGEDDEDDDDSVDAVDHDCHDKCREHSGPCHGRCDKERDYSHPTCRVKEKKQGYHGQEWWVFTLGAMIFVVLLPTCLRGRLGGGRESGGVGGARRRSRKKLGSGMI